VGTGGNVAAASFSLSGILGSERALPEVFQNAHMLVFTGLRSRLKNHARVIASMGRFVFVWFQWVNKNTLY